MSDDNSPMVAAIEELGRAVRSIAHGGISGPEGLEMLAMAVAGEAPFRDNSLASAVRMIDTTEIAEALDNVAASIDRLAAQAGRIANAIGARK